MSIIEVDLIITKMTKSIEIIMSRQKQKKTTVRKNGKKERREKIVDQTALTVEPSKHNNGQQKLNFLT